ncbi:MAG: leucyl aminopeptidase family protein [Alphaproteobacteria bacterium]
MDIRPLTCFAGDGEPAIDVVPIARAGFDAWLEAQSPARAAFVKSAGFKGEAGKVLPLAGSTGTIECFLSGASAEDPFWVGDLPSRLPEGVYRLAGYEGTELSRAALAWAMGSYQFTLHKAATRAPAKLRVSGGVPADVLAAAEAITLVRDLVNAPAGDLGPAELEAAARNVARRHDAEVSVLVGDDLLRKGFALIHGVGRASSREPRLIDLRWGSDSHPKITLVGKGVVFDSGGLDIKPASNMLLMRKDMGGAATALGLAHLVMSAGLKVRLRLLVPAVENAISGNAFRPGDVLESYKGLTVEIGNTDAEGRLILADALALADEETPDLLIDLATLTGAARTALGPELPALYSDSDELADAILAAGREEGDPVWRLPLWKPYAKWLETPFADINNSGSSAFAGSITGALFLQRFVEKAKAWAHFDIYAWNQNAHPAKSIGGEAQAMRALQRVLKARYG